MSEDMAAMASLRQRFSTLFAEEKRAPEEWGDRIVSFGSKYRGSLSYEKAMEDAEWVKFLISKSGPRSEDCQRFLRYVEAIVTKKENELRDEEDDLSVVSNETPETRPAKIENDEFAKRLDTLETRVAELEVKVGL